MKPNFPILDVSRFAQELREPLAPVVQSFKRVNDILNGQVGIADNLNAAIVTLGYVPGNTNSVTLTSGVEYLIANPLRSRPIGFQPLYAEDSNGAPISVDSAKLNLSRTDGFLGVTVRQDLLGGVGDIGEMLGPSSRVRSAATALTSGAVSNVASPASITLTPGSWDIRGAVCFLPQPLTNIVVIRYGISATSAALPGGDTIAVPTSGEIRFDQNYAAGFVPGGDLGYVIPSYGVNVAAGTTKQLFLVATSTFTLSTMTVYGSMEARRMAKLANPMLVTGILWGG